MILSRIIHHLKTQNWTAVAIEFVIVILGVVIGFQVTAWNEARDQRATEAIILTELRTSLETDIASLETATARYELITQRLSGLLAHLREQQAYDPDLDADFGVLYGMHPVSSTSRPMNP